MTSTNQKYENYSIATVDKIARYIEKGYNIFLEGKHGVGKTQMVEQACAKLGYKVLTFNAALMDSFVDLRGVPFSKETDDGTILEMVRQAGMLEDADVIFYDEIGRAQVAELNAVMNTVNEHKVNGEILPSHKSVIGATNTGREYSSYELDPAQKDRFDIFFSCKPKADVDYFCKKFGDSTGKALTTWQHEIIDASMSQDNWDAYVSPRSLEKLGKLFNDFRDIECLEDSLGERSAMLPVNKLFSSLEESGMSVKEIYESMTKMDSKAIKSKLIWMIPTIIESQEEHLKSITSIEDENTRNQIVRQIKFLYSTRNSLKSRQKITDNQIEMFGVFVDNLKKETES